MKSYKNILLGILIGLLLVMIYYTRDLKQVNSETLFLSGKGLKDYQAFLSKAPDHKSLIIQIKTQHAPTLNQIKTAQRKIQLSLDKYEDLFELVSPRDLFRGQKDYQSNYLNAKNNQIIKLIGEKSFSFVVINQEHNAPFNLLIRTLNEVLPVEQTRFAGLPYTNYLLDQYSKTIQEKIFPLMFAFTFVLIFYLTRSFISSIFLFAPSLFSALISLSSIKCFFNSMNMITSIIPLLSFTMSLATLFHLYFTMLEKQSFSKALFEKKVPLFLMVVTTFIGFGSLVLSDIQSIQDFGVLSSTLILMTTLSSLTWLWLSEHFILDSHTKSSEHNYINPNWFKRSFSWSSIFVMAISALCLGLYALSSIRVVTDATEYFPKSLKIKEQMNSIHKNVVGVPLYDVLIEHEKNDLQWLKKTDQLEKELMNKLSQKIFISGYHSRNSFVRQINSDYTGQRQLPDHILAYQTLESQLKHSLRDSYPNEKFYRLTILGNPINVELYETGLSDIKSFLKSHNIKHEINGLYYNLMMSQKSMIYILYKSFLVALILVSTISFLYLKNVRIFFIFLFVNIIPVFISLGFLTILNLSLNIATVMTYSIGLGIIVDSTFHIVHALSHQRMNFTNYVKTIITPVLESSLIFVICFTLFAFHGFLPIKQFGINLGFIMFLGLIFDLKVLPTLFLGHNRTFEVFYEK